LVWWIVGLGFGPALRATEERSADLAWRLQASDVRERRIILIDIDEASISQVGPWPWPRQQLAQLSDRLAAEGAALQVYDIIFSANTSQDATLLASFKKNHAVIAQVFSTDHREPATTGQPSGALDWSACPPGAPLAQGYIAPAPTFADLPAGHITPTIEADGAVRRVPALICHRGAVYPALFIAAIAQALSPKALTLNAGGGPLAPHSRLVGPSFDQDGLALDAHAQVRIPWTLRPEAFISLSATDVLAGRVPLRLLDNAWVVIGSSALGLNDRVASPFSGNTAGLLVHAQLLRGALDGTLPAQPRYGFIIETLVTSLCVVLLGYFGRLSRKPVYLMAVGAVVLAGLLWTAKAWLLTRSGLWFGWVQPAVFLLAFAACHSLIEYARDRIERDRLFNHLSSYLPRPVAAVLAKQDPSDAVDATRRHITVLFAEIRNFSAYCEARPPEESTAVLHAFFAMVTRQVEQHGGLIEFFQGDAVLAVWGSGGAGPAPEKALGAAIAILKESRTLLPPMGEDDIAPMELGIGLETGQAMVGSFGLARRRTHLALGHPVTAAARLQEMTAELAHPILVGEGMAASLGNHRLVSQGMFLLEGLKNPSHIYAYPLRECVE